MKSKRVLLSFAVATLIFFLLSYRLVLAYGFDNDFARDLIQILEIAKGKFTLLGPKSSFGGLYTGPYYYYLFVPVFILFKHSLEAVLFFNVFLFTLSLGYFFYQAAKHFNLIKTTLATGCLAFLPLILIASRNPGNAYTYLALLLGVMTYVIFEKPKTWQQILILGFCSGIIINFHYGTFIVVLTLGLFLFLTGKKKKPVLGYFFGIFFSFFPLLLFEVKHKFIMLKNTFLSKSYTTFSAGNYVETKNISIFSRMLLILTEIKKVIILHPLVFIVIAYLASLKKKIDKEKIFFFLAVLDLLVILLIFKFQFVGFYFYSFALFVFFASLILLLKSKWWWLLGLFFILEIIYFPSYLYQNSTRSWKNFSATADYLINNKIVDKNIPFNIIQLRKDTGMAPYGYEYRFFLMKKGYNPDKESEYSKSKELLIIADAPYDLTQLNSWEAKEFGVNNFAAAKIYHFKQQYIYKITK